MNPPRKFGDVIEYNAAARKIMDEHHVAVDDLYNFALPQLADIQLKQNVHFSPAGSDLLAQQIAKSISQQLAAK